MSPTAGDAWTEERSDEGRRRLKGRGAQRAEASAIISAFAVLALSLTGCTSVDVAFSGPAYTGTLRCEQPDPPGMLVLMAQSVPGAAAVPCLRRAPENWNLAEFEITDGRSKLRFHYEFGDGSERADVEMAPDCDLQGAKEVASEQPDIRRYDRSVTRPNVYADERYYVYPGGCTSLRFNLTGEGIISSLRGAEFAGELSFVSRAALAQRIDEITRGRLRLDPEPAR